MIAPVLVTPPASGDPVVTLAEAKAQVRVTHDTDDDYLEALVATAVDLLDGRRGILGRCLVSQTWRAAFRDWDTGLRLPFPQCSSISLVYSDAADVEQAVAGSAYEVHDDPMSSVVWFRDSFDQPDLYADRRDPIRVTFVAGYGPASAVPLSLKHAIKLLVGHWYENREEVVIGQVDLKRLPMAFEALIAPHRMVPL